ncbi:oligopeptide transporter 3 [Cryptomeria japonica]|uniref:oligopeptide transporter 3 n=1 Tax=Cryptomeria japonica TaxID=3369 RepID=UPI0027DA5EAF|nr:oligopeptide transporter 3 [Cryptomeria japonica]XP_057854385.2 oligopeptide transporter 3 [Cryptomeria japonica]XP_057854393.2 oligopeptide transporter 3 [Cryptomeria japonica]XP_057854399.2 oligopeptide transporter 3 [Cryptomeria japonica]XP_057854402.2 oligopeptide transporter 3 [Cryptomeria japonica]XP_057854419.2 oligopeptide transporter 3 [Cryptomeria japonica]
MGQQVMDPDPEEKEVKDQTPVEEVALVVPVTDDPTLPVFTFRVWTLGCVSCVVLMFLNTFFTYRTQPLVISAILAQILALPMGKFMAAILPERKMQIFGFECSLNPGPFNMKEHVLITIFASNAVSSGGGDAYSIGAITVMKAYYKQSISFIAALIIVISSQILGYGWAGLLRKYLVEPADMWWPSNLAQVSLFRALHEKDNSGKRLSRMQFFIIFALASFAYYTLPGYMFSVLTFFSWVCWIWPHSITAQQIGSGYKGLGVGALSFDWAGISAYHGSPLVTPWFSILNVAVGFVMFIYIIVPICYWKYNVFDSRTYPIFSNQLFKATGHKYDTTKILTPDNELNVRAYNDYGKLYLSPLFALSIGSGFARIAATITHVLLFNGRDMIKRSRSAMNAKLDIHGRMMKRYKEVPEWWFLILLAGSMAFCILLSFVWKDEIQLPWWGMLLACGLSWFLTLPIGVIQATTNQQPGYDIIAQFMFGYILPGKPIANLLFKIYGRISSTHALNFLQDLKLGQYMKIPPRCMYTAQLASTVLAGLVNLAVAWWMLETIEDICDTDVLPLDSAWTCPKYRVTFDQSVIWGLVGPERLFGHNGLYRNLIWLFLVGALLPVPVWVLSKLFPDKKWIPLINIPVITYGFAGMPPATPANIASWILTGTIFNYFVFRYRKQWWQRYNYILSAALDCGTAFMGVLLYFALGSQNHNLSWWGTELDHCPLASCPTAPGVNVTGCPVF